MQAVLAVVAALVIGLMLVSGALRGSAVTAPMLAVVAGVLLGPVAGILPTSAVEGVVLLLAQLTLALLLFVDATRVDLRLARRSGTVPLRMLVIGLPLVIALGTLVGSVLLGLSASVAFVLACVLAPTDAALAQPLLTDDRVPRQVRQAVNVESGLNDGLVTPFLAVALVVVDLVEGPAGVGGVAVTALQLVGGGLVVGVLAGGGVGITLRRVDWHSLQPAARQVGTAAVPVLAYTVADLVGGNGFVAAFVAGVAFAVAVPDAHELVEYGEDTGELFSLLTFLALGAAFVDAAIAVLDLSVVLYAVLSLTLVRMVPITLSLLGTGLRRDTVLLLGWFGPRGLATIVFGLEVLELARDEAYATGETVFGVAALVAVTSVFLHGFSAAPLAHAYERRLGRRGDELAEPIDETDLRVRRNRIGS